MRFNARLFQAAGNWGLAAAWSHIFALVRDAATPKVLAACRHRCSRQHPPGGSARRASRPGRLMTKKSWRPLTRPSGWLKRSKRRRRRRGWKWVDQWSATVLPTPIASGFALLAFHDGEQSSRNRQNRNFRVGSFFTWDRRTDVEIT
jgi:hypothetical protein